MCLQMFRFRILYFQEILTYYTQIQMNGGKIMNISITGNLGSGKSTVCRLLKEQGFDIVSAGTLFREIAANQGINVNELNEKINQNISQHSIDDMIDQRTSELGKQLDHTIFDSRMAWHFVPDSFKVFVHVDIEEAARRVFNDSTRSTEKYSSVEECKTHLKERATLEQERFSTLYGVDYFNMDNYDLVVDSTNKTPEQVAGTIVREFDRRTATHNIC